MSKIDFNKFAAEMFSSSPQPILFNQFGASAKRAEPQGLIYKPKEKAKLEVPASTPYNESDVTKRDKIVEKKPSTKNKMFSTSFRFADDVENDFITPVAKHFKTDPSHLRHIVLVESGGNPAAVNKASGATGLIQFMGSKQHKLPYDQKFKEIKGKKYFLKDIAKMPPKDQSKLAIDYYSQLKLGEGATFSDMYMSTFYPVAVGKQDDYVLGSHVKDEKARNNTINAIAKENKIYDLDKDGKITKEEFDRGSMSTVKRRLKNMGFVDEVQKEGLIASKQMGGLLYKKCK